jgi:hypothetical protein
MLRLAKEKFQPSLMRDEEDCEGEMRRLGALLLGLVMLLTGIGLAVGIFVFAHRISIRILVASCGLVIAGLGLMGRALFFSGYWKRPRSLAEGGLNPLNAVPPGQCWNCGRRVKPNATLCLHCGVAQRSSINPMG